MKFKKLESGRSMVEMLGVLAIIGVLSVGGIAGYSLSMRIHRANGIVDIASKFALVAYSKCQQKILKGEITGLSSCPDNCGFHNSDVGAEPTGLRSSMCVYNISSDKNTGVDTVTVTIPFEFSETKLCQAVASISGTGCSADNFVDINFNQN